MDSVVPISQDSRLTVVSLDMPAQLLGAHMPIKGGLGNAVRDGHAIGCTAVQVFTSSPQQWKAKPVSDEMAADFKKAKGETGIEVVVSHDSYLVNLCAPDEAKRRQSIEGLIAEMDRCAKYGIGFTVSHMGAHMGQGEEEGLKIVAESAREVLDRTDPSVTLLMETTAGQGSSLNFRFETLAWLIDALKGDSRLCVCLDTCHIFAAGYDISTNEGFSSVFAEFERLIGFERLKAVHCNDSKKALGSRVDRHDHIGEGLIGPIPFQMLVNDDRFEKIPILLETPDAPEGHARNLATLKSYIA